MLVPANHVLYLEDEETGALAEFCEEICVAERRVDLLTGDITLLLQLWVKGTCKSIEIERGELSKTLPRKLFDQGLTILPTIENCEVVLDYILESDKLAPDVYRHNRLGFCTVDGKLAFLADTPVGLSDPAKTASHYIDAELTAPVGTFESWLELVKAEVVGKPNMELALAMGISGPVAHLLNDAKVLTSVPIFVLVGQSSTGKTTAQQLMASIFGNPNDRKGLICDLNSTQNGFFASMGENLGLPILVDEATVEPEWPFRKVIYTLPKGSGKRRSDKNGKLIKPVEFSGVIVLSSEVPIIDPNSSKPGMYARFVEFTLPWTDDADHATRLNRGLLSNYGSAVFPLAEWLLKHRNDLPTAYAQEYAKFSAQRLGEGGIEDRLLKLYSVITTSAWVAKSALGLDLDVKGMRETIMQQHRDNLPPLPHHAVIYNHLISSIATNASKFPVANGNRLGQWLGGDIWGEYAKHHGKECVWINQTIFEEMLNKQGESVRNRTLLKELHQHHGLVHFTDRYVADHQLGNAKPPCYCLLWPKASFPLSPEEQEKLETRKAATAKALEKMRIRHSLLADDNGEAEANGYAIKNTNNKTKGDAINEN